MTSAMLDGSAKKPRILARTKYIGADHDLRKQRPGASALARGLVARFGGLVGWIEPGQRGALLHFRQRPVLEPLLLGPELRDVLDQRQRNEHGAIAVGNHNVARKHRHVA